MRPVVTEEGEQLRVIRLDEHLTPEQRMQKSREVREAYQPKIAAFLTPEQQEKFKRMQEAYQAKRPEGTKDSATPSAPQKVDRSHFSPILRQTIFAASPRGDAGICVHLKTL